ncbi:MAG: hypothetical protein JWO38_2041 [Gemmataceae bacterium]|nr:hypothetical protein [Gemmataceae bacterium]
MLLHLLLGARQQPGTRITLMISPAHIRADVFDIRSGSAPLPDHLVVDANVLYWVFYPNFAALRAAGGLGPQPYQTSVYPRFWALAERNGCDFFTVAATLGEFAKVSEFAELEARWLLDPAHPGPGAAPPPRFDPIICKFCRYHYSSQLINIRQDIEALISGLRSSVALLHQFPSAEDEHRAACAVWQPSSGDFPDSVLVGTSQDQGYTNFLSDDSDLATFAGLTLYTANDRTVNAAKAARRLVT